MPSTPSITVVHLLQVVLMIFTILFSNSDRELGETIFSELALGVLVVELLFIAYTSYNDYSLQTTVFVSLSAVMILLVLVEQIAKEGILFEKWQRRMSSVSESLYSGKRRVRKARNRIFENTLTKITESPLLVVLLSIILIVLFAPLYALATMLSEGEVPESGSLVEFLQTLASRSIPELFNSSVYFLTFANEPTNRFVEFIAGVESFLGALLMALFVFSLGRRVNASTD